MLAAIATDPGAERRTVAEISTAISATLITCSTRSRLREIAKTCCTSSLARAAARRMSRSICRERSSTPWPRSRISL